MDTLVDILKIACGFFLGFLALDSFKALVRYVKNRVRHIKLKRQASRPRTMAPPINEFESTEYSRL